MRRRLYGEDAIHSEIAHVLNNIGAEYIKQKGELSMKEAISYCEKRASRISTIEAKKIPR